MLGSDPDSVVVMELPFEVPTKTPLNVADPVTELPFRLPVNVIVKFPSALTKVPPKLVVVPEIVPTGVSEKGKVEQLVIGQDATAIPT
jgi:hypothetical protein